MTEWMFKIKNDWVDGCNRSKIKVWRLMYSVLKLCPSTFQIGNSLQLNTLKRYTFFQSTKRQRQFCQQFLSGCMKSPPHIDIPNEHQHVKLVYIMKSMIELWEVNAFHCEFEPLPSLSLSSVIVLFTKSMFAAIVYILYQTLIYNYTQRPKLPLLYMQ